MFVVAGRTEAFGAYDLYSAFARGTVADAGVLAPEQFASVQVNGAPVTFSSLSTLTFTAAVGTATTTTAPEPVPFALLGGGTLVLAAVVRRCCEPWFVRQVGLTH